MTDVICPGCGDGYANVAMHWSRGSCDPPAFTERQRAILTGLLLVGGRITNPESKKNPHLELTSSNKPLLDWMSDELGVLSRDEVHHVATGDEARENIQNLQPNTDISNREFSDQYRLETRSLDRLWRWRREWYDDEGNRTVPRGLSLDAVAYKVAYAINGRVEAREDGRQTAVIGLTRTNPTDNQLRRFFDGFAPHINRGGHSVKLYLYNSRAFFDHSGWDALPGCAERWPTPEGLDEPDTVCPSCHGRYKQLGSHWAKSSTCVPPDFSDEQYAVIRGLLVSGALTRITTNSTQPHLQMVSANRPALESAAEKLGWLTASLGVAIDAETASDDLSNLADDDVSANDVYVLRTWAHPEFREFYNSTDGVGRRLPDTIPVRPDTLRTIYEFHGTRVTRGSARRVIMNANNTTLSQEQLRELFGEFDAHTESSSRPIVVLKDVTGFDQYVSETYEDGLESVFSR